VYRMKDPLASLSLGKHVFDSHQATGIRSRT
jgi:hypothetical protein